MDPFSLTFKIRFDKKTNTFVASAYGFTRSGRGMSAVEAVTAALSAEENKLHLITRSVQTTIGEKFFQQEAVASRYPAGKTRSQQTFLDQAIAQGHMSKLARNLRAIGILKLLVQGHTLHEVAKLQDVTHSVIHRIAATIWEKIKRNIRPQDIPSGIRDIKTLSEIRQHRDTVMRLSTDYELRLRKADVPPLTLLKRVVQGESFVKLADECGITTDRLEYAFALTWKKVTDHARSVKRLPDSLYGTEKVRALRRNHSIPIALISLYEQHLKARK